MLMTFDAMLKKDVENVVEVEHYNGVAPRQMYGCYLVYRKGEYCAFKTREEAVATARYFRGSIVTTGVFVDNTLYIELS